MTAGQRPLAAYVTPDAADLVPALSSLARSFVQAPRDRADVLAVGGAGDWAARAHQATAAGLRGVLVLRPAAAAPGVLHELAEASRQRGVPVVLARTWAESALADLLRRGAAAAAGQALLVQSTVCGAMDTRTLLTEQLGVLRGLASWPPEPARVRSGAGGYLGHVPLRVGATTVPAAVTGIRGTGLAPRLTLRVHWEAGVLRAEAGTPGSARPWRLTTATGQGEVSHPADYESGYRRAWLRLRAALDGRGPADEDVSVFAADCSVAAQALGPIGLLTRETSE